MTIRSVCAHHFFWEKGPNKGGLLTFQIGYDIPDGASQPVKINLNKKLDPKQKTIQTFNIDGQGFRKTNFENALTREIRVTSQPVPAGMPTMGRPAGTV